MIGGGEHSGGAGDVIRGNSGSGDGGVVNAFQFVGQGFQAGGILRQPCLVGQLIVHDDAENGAEENEFGAGNRAQPEIGVAG